MFGKGKKSKKHKPGPEDGDLPQRPRRTGSAAGAASRTGPAAGTPAPASEPAGGGAPLPDAVTPDASTANASTANASTANASTANASSAKAPSADASKPSEATPAAATGDDAHAPAHEGAEGAQGDASVAGASADISPISLDQVLNALKAVTDPEIGLDVVELGLVYGVDISPDGKRVNVSMTLTSPMCPYGPQIVSAAQAAAGSVAGVEEAMISLVWVPRWDPREHASEDAKAFLGIW